MSAKNSLVEIMSGQVSIVDIYASQNVIVLRLQNPADKPVNSMTLSEPFHRVKSMVNSHFLFATSVRVGIIILNSTAKDIFPCNNENQEGYYSSELRFFL